MKRNVIETIMGGLVLVVAFGFLFFAFKSGNVQSASGYTIKAKFDRVDGLVVGADIRVSGIKVGAVTEQTIDPQTYQAIISMTVIDDVKIPTDSSAEIVGDGLLGGKYIAIVPGGSSDMVAAGGELEYTQSSVSLEALIGKMIYGGSDSKKGKDKQ
jgi:phospholipid/cholesterol/gamma-HCH transport system substrate-binding protein